MVMVEGDRVSTNVDCHRLGAGCVAVPTFYVIGNNVKVRIVYHIVGAHSHIIETLAVESHIMWVPYGGTCGLTTFVGTLPLTTVACAEMDQMGLELDIK